MKAFKNLTMLTLLFGVLSIYPLLSYGATNSCGDKKSCSTKKEYRIHNDNNLVIVWSRDDPMVAKRVALMYPHAEMRNKWFDEVTLVIWGPSAKLISENVELQNKLSLMQKDGVIVKACIACANEYGVTDKLKQLGYYVVPMGIPLTDYLKEGYKVLTF